MQILVLGNQGYVGPAFGRYVKNYHPSANLIGFDSGLFIDDWTVDGMVGDLCYAKQYRTDVRHLKQGHLQGMDAVVSLAAVSNDPMGKAFKRATLEVNELAVVDSAMQAKSNGVKKFVFASSCSVYGFGGNSAKTEQDEINPLTDYAVSKINAEKKLRELADDSFQVTCLRFATACGVSDRTRLDLVLNDFVWSLLNTGKVHVLSDGSPLRPLIDVMDMSRAIYWAIDAKHEQNFEVYNCGYNEANYSVAELAYAVADGDHVRVAINKHAEPDKRSYKVNFSKFENASGFSSPLKSLGTSISELKEQLNEIKKRHCEDEELSRRFKRHETLKKLMTQNLINEELEWRN